MRESVIAVALSVLSGVLLIGAVFGIALKDRTAPVISIEGKNNLSYAEGDDMDVLLKNVTAEDEKDGDVTESIRVSDIYETRNGRAMVIYVAKDTSNNIAKLKREIYYVQKEDSAEMELEQTEAEQTDDEQANIAQVGTEQANTSVAAAQAQLTGARVNMLQKEVTLKVGENFNILRYIQNAVDANGNDISRSMYVEGNYDTNVAGVYELKIYAVDSAQTRTNEETFRLTVEP